VATFVLFALGPLLLFAWQSHRRVTAVLTTTAAEKARQDVKTAGVMLLERLALAARQLAYEGTGESETIAETGDPFALGLLDPQTPAELADRDALLRLRGDELWLVTSGSDGSFLAGRVDPAYVFDPDGLVPPRASFSVHAPNGALVHAVGDAPPSVATLREAGLGTEARGELRWGEGDDTRLGAYWEVFLRPRFGTNLAVALHDRRSRVLAPLHGFERDFLTVALLTLAIVALASLVRVRRILNPVGRLVAATQRIARRDFGVRVEVRGRDEFSELGSAFNAMAEDLEHREQVLGVINAFGANLAVERSPRMLMRRLSVGATRMLRVDGVLIHTFGESGHLEVDQLWIRSLDLQSFSGGGQDRARPVCPGARPEAPRRAAVDRGVQAGGDRRPRPARRGARLRDPTTR
jgi:HAMP domain-containing protein